MALFDIVVCPSCGGRLHLSGSSIVCENRHTFDVASSGYVNLLPPGKNKNAHTGDDKTMIRARCDFLSLGLYGKISDAAADTALPHLSSKDSITAIDAGCGEGYHICRIADRLHEKSGRDVTAIGFDASKNGAMAGAKRSKSLGFGGSFMLEAQGSTSVFFAAANIFSMPAADRSADVIYSMFAPIPADEAMRILTDDGMLVVVAAGDDHLYELREVLYDEPRKGDGSVAVPDGFVITEHETVRYTAHVPDNTALINLFTMTPFYYRTPESGRRRLEETASLDVTVHTEIYLMKKKER